MNANPLTHNTCTPICMQVYGNVHKLHGGLKVYTGLWTQEYVQLFTYCMHTLTPAQVT
jgi:hypothetical protein